MAQQEDAGAGDRLIESSRGEEIRNGHIIARVDRDRAKIIVVPHHTSEHDIAKPGCQRQGACGGGAAVQSAAKGDIAIGGGKTDIRGENGVAGVGLRAGGGDVGPDFAGARNAEINYICHCTLELGIVSDGQVVGACHRVAEGDQLVGVAGVCRQDGVGGECDRAGVGLRAGGGDIRTDGGDAGNAEGIHA